MPALRRSVATMAVPGEGAADEDRRAGREQGDPGERCRGERQRRGWLGVETRVVLFAQQLRVHCRTGSARSDVFWMRCVVRDAVCVRRPAEPLASGAAVHSSRSCSDHRHLAAPGAVRPAGRARWPKCCQRLTASRTSALGNAERLDLFRGRASPTMNAWPLIAVRTDESVAVSAMAARGQRSKPPRTGIGEGPRSRSAGLVPQAARPAAGGVAADRASGNRLAIGRHLGSGVLETGRQLGSRCCKCAGDMVTDDMRPSAQSVPAHQRCAQPPERVAVVGGDVETWHRRRRRQARQ